MEKQTLEGCRVLVVDDSRSIQRFLSRLLSEQGAEVLVASSGTECIDLWKQRGPFDLILLDLILPDMSGIDVLREIRQQDQESTVVVITGAGGVRSAVAAVQEGADGYIEKQSLAMGDDYVDFFYQLHSAMSVRAGLAAQRQLEHVRTDFYNMITHDLRNPAGAILQITQMLLKGELGPLTKDQQFMLTLAEEAARRLMNLITDYLDFAKIGEGMLRLNFQEVVLQDAVRQALQLTQFQTRIREQSLVIDLPDEPLIAEVDFDRIVQVLDNLLSNAVKYTLRKGHITLRLRREGNWAVFQVQDDGVGIPAEYLPHLFQKYQRVPGTEQRAVRGTGLGLLIVKEVVEAHGGEVSVFSAGEGKGATFTVRLPLRQQDREAAE